MVPRIKEIAAVSPKMYVGAVGTFFGGLPGEKIVQATGEIVKIMEGPNYAVVSVKMSNGETRLLAV